MEVSRSSHSLLKTLSLLLGVEDALLAMDSLELALELELDVEGFVELE